MKKRLIAVLKRRWRMGLMLASIGGISLLLVLFKLGSLMPAANQAEAAAAGHLTGFQLPWQHPLDYPYYLVAKLFSLVFSPLYSLRLASAFGGLLMIFALSYTLRTWFNNRIAAAGALFMLTSSWFLQLARIGTPSVMPALWLALLFAIGTWRTYTNRPRRADATLAVVVSLSLYSTYFVWLLIIGIAVLSLRRKQHLFVLPRKHQWLLPVIALPLITPLVFGLVNDYEATKAVLGLAWVSVMPLDYLKQIFENVSQIFFRGQSTAFINLGRLPLLDIFSVVMVALGLRHIERHIGLRRNQLIIALSLLLVLIISLQPFNILNLAVMYPLVMLVAVSGIVEMLERWLKSFPHNPVARSVGVCVMVVAIGFTSYYHLERYFVAWPKSPATKELYSIKQ